MELTSDGVEVKWVSFTHRQSLTEHCASLNVLAAYPLSGEFTLKSGNVTCKVVALGYQTSSGKFLTILRPKIIAELADKILPPFKGEFTTEEILQQVGLDTVAIAKTEKVYWEFPSLPFKDFITHLEYHTQIAEGGGCFINITLEGYAQITDLNTIS